MNELGSGRPKSVTAYTNASPIPSQAEIPWKNLGTSLNAISFGFVATAILISMFLIMAIFEHLLRPRLSLSSEDADPGSLESGTMQDEKFRSPQTASKSYSTHLSVLMPGQDIPTCLAQPAPLPCPREGMHWPSYNHGLVYL